MIDYGIAEIFPSTVSQVNDVTTVTRQNSTTVPIVGNTVRCPALSTLVLHIQGTASVKVSINAFKDPNKLITVGTYTTSTAVPINTAMDIQVQVVTVSGTVTAGLIYNNEVD